MTKANIKATFKSDIFKVWEVVTNNKEYGWRSDLSKIEVRDNGNVFIEYSKGGFETTFTITRKDKAQRYEFDMKNKNMRGHWTGIFKKSAVGTEIDFTEEVTVNNPVMKLFAGMYLKKQQKQYIEDLKKALGE